MKNIFVLILLFMGLNLPAQDIVWKDLSKYAKRAFRHKLIKMDDGSLLDVEGKKANLGLGRPSFVRYDAQTLTEQKRVAYKLKEKNRSTVLGVEQVGHKVYLFVVTRAKDRKTTGLYVEEIDPKSLQTSHRKELLKVSRRKKSITTVRVITNFHADDGADRFFYDISPDSSKIVVGAKSEARRKEPTRFNVAVYDQNMKQLWTKVITMKNANDNFFVGKINVDNNGNLFFASWDEDNLFYEVEDESLWVHTYLDNGENYQKFHIYEKKLVFPKNPKLWAIKPGVYNLVSSYRKRKLNGNLGYFFQQIDANQGNLLEPVLNPVKEIVPACKSVCFDKSTGKSTLFMEDNKTIVAQTRHGAFYKYYTSSSIAILQFDETGKLNWHRIIEKDQQGSYNTRLISFVKVCENDKFHIFFNDNKSNVSRRREHKKLRQYAGRKDVVFRFDISRNGRLSRAKVFLDGDKPPILTEIYHVDDKNYIIFTKKNIGRLKF